ncbi:MAG TPA: LuxR C-terminal-related transcriptional regulator [Hanamia sp.]|jgi:DNA-binding CsgD family transcriptional regulator|nr:LuxR C-terminal-related transcriptional regulator [Hanamia sp.]
MQSKQNGDPKKDDKQVLNRQTKPAKLTKREKEVMILLCLERTTKQIAYELRLSVHTIETYRKSLIRKTGSVCVAGVISYAFRNKYVAQALVFLLHDFVVDYAVALSV